MHGMGSKGSNEERKVGRTTASSLLHFACSGCLSTAHSDNVRDRRTCCCHHHLNDRVKDTHSPETQREGQVRLQKKSS